MTGIHDEEEIWKTAVGFPHYAVSNLGRVKRVKPDAYGRTLAVILKPVARPDGYIAYSMHNEGVQKVRLGHRLVCEAFHGPQPKGKPHACHNDGDKANNKADNVRWDSPVGNNNDKIEHGTLAKGDKHSAVYDGSYLPRGSGHKMAKLDENDVIAIRADTRSTGQIGIAYGVSQSLISMIKTRKIWKHI